jgi:hypothetical protein
MVDAVQHGAPHVPQSSAGSRPPVNVPPQRCVSLGFFPMQPTYRAASRLCIIGQKENGHGKVLLSSAELPTPSLETEEPRVYQQGSPSGRIGASLPHRKYVWRDPACYPSELRFG